MDFLDPKKKRAHKNRLMVGYALVAVAIGLATVILVYGAYGYGINTKTGDVVENGLLFTGSKPSGANVYLNGESQDKTTPARLVLPSGDYDLVMKKDGYHDWQRRFTLEEHSVERYLYPFLLPTNPQVANIKTYNSNPPLIAQSPDQRRLLIQQPLDDSLIFVFEEYDTDNIDQSPRSITINPGLLTSESAKSKLLAVEWSSDSNYLLLKHSYSGGSEFLILDRRSPANSLNLNILFKVAPSEVLLRDKKIDEVFVYDQKNQSLRVGDVSEGALRPVFLNNVLAFKPHTASLISYITAKGAPKDKVEARIWDNGRTYSLYSFAAGTHYLIDAGQFQGSWYYVAGSDKTDRINIFKNPLDGLKNPDIKLAVPMMTLRILGANTVDFSENGRFVGIQAGQKFAVYDFEGKDRYQYSFASKLAGLASWMDGHRFIGASGSKVVVFDFDGSNQQSVTSTNQPSGGYFSRDFNHLFTTSTVKKSKEVILQNTDMRAGSDLPEE